MIRTLEIEAAPPISVAEARDALRISQSLDGDLLERKLRAAVRHVESRTNRLLRRHTLALVLDGWPVYGSACDFEGIRLQRVPVREVTAVEYRTDAGAWLEVPADQWHWERRDYGAEVQTLADYALPTLSRHHRDRLRVTFDAGYLAEIETGEEVDPELALPEDLREAVLLLAGHWYEHIEAVTEGDVVEVPLALSMIIQGLRVFL